MKAIPLRTLAGLELSRLYRGVQTRLHELTYLFWECTLRCSLRCVHCGSDCRSDTAVPDMPLEDFLGVVDRIRDSVNPHKTIIAITGGEPLMRADLERAGRELHRREFPWGMVTNGWLLSAERFSGLLDAGLTSITVSLDGLEQEHDWFRGRSGSFRRACAAIERCAATPRLTFDVVTCITRRTIGQLEQIRALLQTLGVKRWRVLTVFAKGRASGNPDFKIEPGQFRDLLDFIASTRGGPVEASYGCEGFLGAWEGRSRDQYFFCRAGINIASVLVDGSISACPSLRGDYVQGNIYRDDFLDVWERRFAVMRDRRWTRTGECRDCAVYRYCGGNGLHLRDEKSGELLMCQYRLLEEAETVRGEVVE